MMTMLKNAGLATVAYFAPVHALMVATLGLILVDLVLGVCAALKRGEKISSAGFRRTVIKILAFEAAIVGALILESVFLPQVPVTKLVAAAISLTEGTSIIENLRDCGLDLSALKKFLRSENDEAPK